MRVVIQRALSIGLIPKCYKIAKRYTRKKEPLVFISLTEHIGDVIAAEPISRLLKKQYPSARIIWVVKDKLSELVQYNPNVSEVLSIKTMSEWYYIRFFLKPHKIFDLHLSGKSCDRYHLKIKNNSGLNISNYSRFSLLEAFSISSGLPFVAVTPNLYFPDVTINHQLPKGYIAIHTLTNQVEKNWDNVSWQTLIKGMPEFCFVEVGTKSIIDSSFQSANYQNLCGKTSSFSEIASIIKNASFFVGLDSAFAHFSNALQKPGIVLFGNHNGDKFIPFSGYYSDQKDKYIMRKTQITDITAEEVIARINLLMNPSNPKTS